VRQRFAPESTADARALLTGADNYVAGLSAAERTSLHLKPYDRNPGHPTFFAQMYAVLNTLREMGLQSGATVLEVGCGPGWVTELLVGLGLTVEALDPSAAMLAFASERVRSRFDHLHDPSSPNVRFHQATLEDCPLADASVDGVLMCESLHHVIDERRGLREAFRVLRPWGVLAICAEPNWNPGNQEQEAYLRETMQRFGILESPLTFEYLHEVLLETGFIDVVRYHAINALIAVGHEMDPAMQYITTHAGSETTATARKPGLTRATTRDPSAPVDAAIEILEVRHADGEARCDVTVRLVNTGPTAWLSGAGLGRVTLALRQQTQSDSPVVEASPRSPLPRLVAPREEVTMSVGFLLPAGSERETWFVDLISEGNYWFSSRGVACPRMSFD
jgi:ubiquinone/menaquinone biosynthesis C-methylase UbiE